MARSACHKRVLGAWLMSQECVIADEQGYLPYYSMYNNIHNEAFLTRGNRQARRCITVSAAKKGALSNGDLWNSPVPVISLGNIYIAQAI